MNVINMSRWVNKLKSNDPATLEGFIYWLFVLSGTQFYMDWLLITNPTSKNPLVRIYFGYFKGLYSFGNAKDRFSLAIKLFTVHLIFAIMGIRENQFFSLENLFINIYPMMVQLYIGYRCYLLKTHNKLKKFG